MPFLTLNNNWSNLAQYYNQSFNNKPEVPTLKYTAFDDGLIRGGILNANLASSRDAIRISKFFASGKGALFITKQVGLQLSNPLLEQETPTDTFGKLSTKLNLLNKAAGVINTATSAINSFISQRSPNQIYNLGLNTLAQIPLNAFGGHIIRQGTLPIGGGGYLNGSTDNIKGYNYLAIATKHNNYSKQTTSEIESKPNNTNNTPQNGTGVARNQVGANVTREQTLNELVITSGLSYKNAPNRLLQYLKNINTDNSNNKVTGLINRPITLQEYKGGSDSIYGIGTTSIKTYPDQRTNVSNIKNDPKAELLNGFIPKSYSDIDNKSNKLSTSVNRQKQSFITPDDSISSPSGSSYNIESRIGVSTLGGRNVDSINVINIVNENIFYDLSVSGPSGTLPSNDPKVYEKKAINTDLKNAGGYFGRDIIKFRIEFLNNDTNLKEVLAFRAYIDDFNDGMNAKWDSYRYMGRGEEFYVYNGFTRDINVAFTMYAHSPTEMKPLYQKLNYLMSAFTPDYNAANKMRGNIGYLTVGDYVYRQPGIFTDIKLSGMLDTHWEIAYDDELPKSSNQYEVPKHIKVALSFKPIHNFLPRRVSAEGNGTTPFVKAPFVTRNSNDNKYLKTD